VGRGCCAALEFIQVRDLQAVLFAGIVKRAIGCAHGGTQGQSADSAHAIDTHFHWKPPECSNTLMKVELCSLFMTSM
jgi:hypothetical protein